MEEQKDPRTKPAKEPEEVEQKGAPVREESELSDEELTAVAGGKPKRKKKPG
jgi:hypothetical protein